MVWEKIAGRNFFMKHSDEAQNHRDADIMSIPLKSSYLG